MYDILHEFNVYAVWPALKVTDRMFVTRFFLKSSCTFQKVLNWLISRCGGKKPN